MNPIRTRPRNNTERLVLGFAKAIDKMAPGGGESMRIALKSAGFPPDVAFQILCRLEARERALRASSENLLRRN